MLAGGFGTRLRSAVSAVPKPLAPVIDRPFLMYLLENWVGQGLRSFIFMLHHQADVIETFLEREATAGTLRDCRVRTVVEPRPLGTGGAIANAVREAEVSGSFIVANADTWLGDGIRDVSAAVPPAMAVVRVENTERYGSARLAGDRIVSFEEKGSSAGAGWINAGLYHLEAAEFASWGDSAFSLETDLFPRWASAGCLNAVRVDSDFVDIGIPEDYLHFCRWAESRKSGAL